MKFKTQKIVSIVNFLMIQFLLILFLVLISNVDFNEEVIIFLNFLT